MSFLPEGTTIEQPAGQFLKLEEGSHRFRALDSAITGVVYWKDVVDEDGTTKRKPVRVRTGENIPVGDIDPDSPPKKFWAFPIYNFDANRIQTLELTQKTLMEDLLEYTKDSDFGNPQDYDIVITRTGKGMETRYSLIAKPPKPLDPKIILEFKELKKSGRYNIERLYDGGYPLEDMGVPITQVLQKLEADTDPDEIDLSDVGL